LGEASYKVGGEEEEKGEGEEGHDGPRKEVYLKVTCLKRMTRICITRLDNVKEWTYSVLRKKRPAESAVSKPFNLRLNSVFQVVDSFKISS
jgi:hypothetical protein